MANLAAAGTLNWLDCRLLAPTASSSASASSWAPSLSSLLSTDLLPYPGLLLIAVGPAFAAARMANLANLNWLLASTARSSVGETWVVSSEGWLLSWEGRGLAATVANNVNTWNTVIKPIQFKQAGLFSSPGRTCLISRDSTTWLLLRGNNSHHLYPHSQGDQKYGRFQPGQLRLTDVCNISLFYYIFYLGISLFIIRIIFTP